MTFHPKRTLEILSSTPATLESLLIGLSDDWLKNNEGENTWSPYDVVGHLIHGEKTDWITRTKVILSKSDNKTFEPFDRFAQMNGSQNQSIKSLLKEFRSLREENLLTLRTLNVSFSDLDKKGIHPALGEVTLRQLLSTWVVHDLGHIAQISRVMAKQYSSEVGPWTAYLKVLSS
ncbi:MAG: DinB family protein [Bacteroidota bacterium]